MYSEQLSDSIRFLTSCKEEYSIAEQRYEDANSEIQDLLHLLELSDLTYHDGAKVAKALTKIRSDRRDAETVMTQLKPVVTWITDNPNVIKSLEKLLGEVRKAERISNPDNRHYTQRTTIIKEVLGREECLL